ncbi:RidA family protein [Aquimarina sp. RZ0]|uniref:RidA family protein n=1 Tax=Aquimarina sp. RZ0 TaxID=2607730 RepID=UPI0011F165B4|nr:RidA family protein [Aquimarina sp. RZ0]KAA1243373.1 RidA family protein [Aquimarina sp. RZ0]
MRYFFLSFVILLINCNSTIQETQNSKNLYPYDVSKKILDLGIQLTPPKLPPGISIEMATRTGNYIYLSGNGPITAKGERITGKVGVDLTVEQGYDAARLTAINHLSVLKEKIGDLNKVVKIVKVFGMVNSDSSFTDHPKVINGYSDLIIDVFGERGTHARSAVGMISLPWNLACEIETIVEIRD